MLPNRFEDTLDNDQESSPADNASNNYKKASAKAHLDYHPSSNLKLETKSDSSKNPSKSSNNSGKNATGEVSSSNRSKPSETARKGSREDVGNESDVSRDSLEVSHRGFVKRNAKGSTKRSVPKTESSQDRSTDHPKTGIERMFAKDRQTLRQHSNSLSSNEEVTATTILQESYTSRFDTSTEQNQTPKPVNVYTSTYSERHQKQQDSYSSSKAQEGYNSSKAQDGYGSSKAQDGYSTKITINGGPSEDRKRSEDDGRSSKFPAKKAPAPAGGMFTQINPFQVSSSKLQQRTRGPWAVNQQQPNGEQPEFQSRRENIGYSGPKLSLKESSMKHRQF